MQDLVERQRTSVARTATGLEPSFLVTQKEYLLARITIPMSNQMYRGKRSWSQVFWYVSIPQFAKNYDGIFLYKGFDDQ